MRRRSILWLCAAAALFAIAAVLMRTTKPVSARDQRPKPPFPKQLTIADSERLAARQRVFPAPADAGPNAMPMRRDRLLAALPPIKPGESKTALVIEVAALRSTPIAQLLMDCFRGGKADNEMKRLGLDVDTVERVAQTDDATLLEGKFGDVDWSRVFPGDKATKLGDHATLHEHVANERTTFVADVDGKLLVGGRDRAAIEAAIARLETGGETENQAIPDANAYGEIYGVVAVDKIAQMLGRKEPDLAERLRAAANHVELHVDASSDVLIVADVDGPDGPSVADLGKTLGGAISLGRMQAKADEDPRLAGLLEGARIVPRGDSFQTEVALPLELLERELADCKKGRE